MGVGDESSVYFGIEVTRRCNLRCPHCYVDAGGRAHPGPGREALCGLLTQLARAGIRTVAFSGGEPLLRRDLERVMLHGLAEGIRAYALVTNGFYAEPARARSLKRAGLEAVQVSLDGVDRVDHCAVRECSTLDFYRALRAVRVFQDAGVVVDVASIIWPANVARAAEMVLLCEALQARYLRYCTFIPTGRAADQRVADRFHVEPEHLDRFFEFLRAVTSEEGPPPPVRVVTDHGVGPWSSSGEFRCEAGREVAYVSAEGDLYPCPGTIFDELVVGNVFESPVQELLASARLARVRGIRRAEITEPCRGCDNDRCTGGCRGAAFAAGRDLHAAPRYCNVIRRRQEAREAGG
jgi:radical SAM protein with 4Fe4S-binding SPASM domain